jgi:ADP-ribose pyrophosphatase YjhB (NUDIX family)
MNDTTPPIATPRVAAGVLFFDDHGNVLLVDPSYKQGLEVPGGYVEPGESPRAACIREVHENSASNHPSVISSSSTGHPPTTKATKSSSSSTAAHSPHAGVIRSRSKPKNSPAGASSPPKTYQPSYHLASTAASRQRSTPAPQDDPPTSNTAPRADPKDRPGIGVGSTVPGRLFNCRSATILNQVDGKVSHSRNPNIGYYARRSTEMAVKAPGTGVDKINLRDMSRYQS